jgi:uncharacterized protein YkwD
MNLKHIGLWAGGIGVLISVGLLTVEQALTNAARRGRDKPGDIHRAQWRWQRVGAMWSRTLAGGCGLNRPILIYLTPIVMRITRSSIIAVIFSVGLFTAAPAALGDQVPTEWSDMLKAHNERRSLHCAPPLTWSNQLAQSAQSYANMCILDRHGSTGENMADRWSESNGHPVLPASTDRQAFENTWYCEIRNYDFNNPTFKGGFTSNCQNVNGHFTQVIWKDTRQLGCGRAICTINGHQGTHWVCRYAPPGNVNTSNVSVLNQEVLRPQCNR